MQKLTPSYLIWKLLIGALMLVMLLAFTAPVYYLLSTGDFSGPQATKITSVVAFFCFYALEFFFVYRSDLSKITFRTYCTGELSVYFLLCLVSAGVLFGVSGGTAPTDFSYGSFLFLPCTGCAYLTGNVFVGLPLQMLLYALLFPLLYFVKKKKDPTLGAGRAGKAPSDGARESKEKDGEES